MGYATQQQKLDYLFKKIGFTKSKTGVAEDQTTGFSGDTKKAGPNESIASPLVIPSTGVYADSQSIPSTPPISSTSVVGIHTVGNPFRMTVDTTVANERAFVARETWGQPVSAIKGDWIDTQFGTDYLVKVHLGDPSTVSPGAAYTYLSAAGTSGKDDTWFFDYSSGVLNFNGADDVSGITTSNVYIVGYRYLGTKGVQPPSGIGTFNDLYVSGVSTFVGVGTFNSHLYVGGNLEVKGTTKFEGATSGRNVVWDKSENSLEFADNAKAVFGGSESLEIFHDSSDSYIKDVGTGSLNLTSNGRGFLFTKGGSEQIANLLTDSAVELFWDNSKKFSTSGIGVTVDYQLDTTTLNVSVGATFMTALKMGHAGLPGAPIDFGNYGQIRGGSPGLKLTTSSLEDISILASKDVLLNSDNDFGIVSIGTHISVAGVSTFTGYIDANSDLDVDGKTDLDDLSVSGVSTFSNQVYIAEGKNLTFGSSTIFKSESNAINLDTYSGYDIILESNASGGTTGDIHLKSNGTSLLSAYGHGTLQIAGITTFTKLIDANSDLDVDGKTDLDDLSVAGVTTFSDDVNLQGANAGVTSAYWDKSANQLKFLDNAKLSFGGSNEYTIFHKPDTNDLRVEVSAGTNYILMGDVIDIKNAAGNKHLITAFGNNGTDNYVKLSHNGEERLRTTGIGVSVLGVGAAQTAYIEGPDEIWIDPHPYGVGTTSGIVRIRGDLYVDGKEFYVDSTTIELADHRVGIATTVGTNSLLDGGGIGIGSANILKTLVWNNSSSSLKSSENFDLLDNKVYKINGTTVLSKDGLGIGITNFNGVIEQLVTKNLRVTGVSTFTGNIDANGDLDVNGKTDLDDVSISGVTTGTTFFGNFNSTSGVSTAKVTSGAINLHNKGTSGHTFIRVKSEGNVDTNIIRIQASGDDSSTDSAYGFNIKYLGTGTGNNNYLSFFGDNQTGTEVEALRIYQNGLVHATSTAGLWAGTKLKLWGDGTDSYIDESGSGNLFVRADDIIFNNASGSQFHARFHNGADVQLAYNNNTTFRTSGIGVTIYHQLDTTNMSVSGVSTFTGAIDANGALDVDGQTDLDVLNVSEKATFSSDIDVDGKTDLDDLSVSGVSTFSSAIDADGRVDIALDLDVDGKTDLDDLSVAGVSTFSKLVDADDGLDVAGHSELDEINVSGITTTTQLQVGTVGQTLVGINTILDEDNMASDSATALVTQQSVKAYVDSQVTAQDLDITDGSTTIAIDLDSETLSVLGTANEVTSSASGNQVQLGLPDNVTIANKLTVTGDLDVDGKTDLDDLSVAGVSTFSANIDADGNLDVDGQTDLDVLNVSEKATFSSDIDVDGKTDLDDLSVSGVSTFTALVDLNSDIDVDGQTTLDDLNVSGISTFAGIATFTSSDVYIDNNLYVGGIQINPGTGITTPSLDIDEYIRHNGDANTRFGFPATDTFIIDTAGTERVRINHVGHTTASGTLNSQTDVQINGTSVLTTAENDAIALAIALG